MLRVKQLAAILYCAILAISYSDAFRAPSPLTRTGCPTIRLKNGRSRYRQKSGFVQNVCNKGFILAGDKYMKCTNSRWEGADPMCVRNTCRTTPEPPNGFVYPSHRGGVLNFFCKPGFELEGPTTAFCDGVSWSTYLPVCKALNKTVSLNCDFEHEDICGWTHDLSHNFDWTRHNRHTPSSFVSTGPTYDHTLGAGKEGYYMYIEASSKNPKDKARLISPVHTNQENNTCLEFWYHMYGATMGELRVYLNRITRSDWNFPADQALFTAIGNHGNRWLRGFIDLGIIDEDFQIIFEAVRGGNYMSDTAIDDVKIFENCVVPEAEPTEDTTSTDMSSTDDGREYLHNWSCQNRCGTETSLFCSCNTECYDLQNCCADYEAYCLDVDTELPAMEETSWSTMSIDIVDLDDPTDSPTPNFTEEDENYTQESTLTVESPLVPNHNHSAVITKISTAFIRPGTSSTTLRTTTKMTTVTKTTTTTSKKTTIPKSTMTSRTTLRTTPKVWLMPVLRPKLEKTNKNNQNKTKEVKKQRQNENETQSNKLSKQVPVDNQAGFSMILLVVSTVAATLVVGIVAMVKLRHRCAYPLRMRQGQSSDSQSDVRFLTSDEILDFSLASSTL